MKKPLKSKVYFSLGYMSLNNLFMVFKSNLLDLNLPSSKDFINSFNYVNPVVEPIFVKRNLLNSNYLLYRVIYPKTFNLP